MIGHGHGSAFIRAFIERLLATGTPRVVIDPDPANARAIRAYEKAGFRQRPAGRHAGRHRPSDGTQRMTDFSPREIVSELDRFIIGQGDAKRAVAIALRNRWRRLQLDDKLREEVLPKNILMIGPTGVGKTEISRRLARLAGAPFLKVEATKFTEVGYVGRDVEQIVRDLRRGRIAHDARAQAQGRAGARRAGRRGARGRRAGRPERQRRRPRRRSARSCAPASSNDKEIEIEVQQSGGGHADVRNSRHAGRADGRDLDRRHLRQAGRRTHQDAPRHRAGIATSS